MSKGERGQSFGASGTDRAPRGLSVHGGWAIGDLTMLSNGGVSFGEGHPTDHLGVRRGESVSGIRRKSRDPRQTVRRY